MQELVIIQNDNVIVQTSNKVYDDTYSNFILDGGETLPNKIEKLDYDKGNKSCYINGKFFKNTTNEYAERVLNSIDSLISNKEKREEEKRKQEEADRLANMTQEEKEALALEQAKNERAEAVSKIIVTVDGMDFDGDETAQTRMGRTVSAAVALGVDIETYTQTWVLANNTVATPTIKQLAQALKLAGEKQTELWTVPYTE